MTLGVQMLQYSNVRKKRRKVGPRTQQGPEVTIGAHGESNDLDLNAERAGKWNFILEPRLTV